MHLHLRFTLLHEHPPGLTGVSMRIQAGGPSRRMFLRYSGPQAMPSCSPYTFYYRFESQPE
jgi:hypothetical protein